MENQGVTFLKVAAMFSPRYLFHPSHLVFIADAKPRQMEPLPSANSIRIVETIHVPDSGYDWFKLRQWNAATVDEFRGAPERIAGAKAI